LSYHCHHRPPHSFPTRRSSDLDARTPMLVSVLSMVTNYALNWLFVRRLGFGHVGLALATSAVALGNFGLLFVVLRRRVGGFGQADRKSTRLNSSHEWISYAVFC